jgi:transcriptional regulator with XRE-family HTH domain
MSQRLGLRIRSLRRLKRVTQQELADMIGISVTTLSNIERGRKAPLPQLLEKIARKLDVPGEELFMIRECHDAPKNTAVSSRAGLC